MEEIQGVSVARNFSQYDEDVPIGSVIRQIARLYEPILARKHNILTLQIGEGLPCVRGNADELTQVLFNLISNAGNHTENGEVKVYVAAGRGQVEVTVTDTGIGISPDLLPRVFDRGVSGKDGGAGLACRSVRISSRPMTGASTLKA